MTSSARTWAKTRSAMAYKKHVPFLATLFFFILISNFVGLIPGCKTPTGTISVHVGAFARVVRLLQLAGHQAHGGWGLPQVHRAVRLPKVMVPVIWFFEFVSLVLRPADACRPTLRQHVRRPYGARHLRAGHDGVPAVHHEQHRRRGRRRLVRAAAGPCTRWSASSRSFRRTCSPSCRRSTSRSPRPSTRKPAPKGAAACRACGVSLRNRPVLRRLVDR